MVGLIFRNFAGTSEHIKTMFSSAHDFEGWRRSREASCAALFAQCFSMSFLERQFCDFGAIHDLNGDPVEAPGDNFFHSFSIFQNFIRF